MVNPVLSMTLAVGVTAGVWVLDVVVNSVAVAAEMGR